ncbi:bola protein [Rhypophila decipiens]|uniref:Bola protein n=1 Tax=Rhypophila decipiens TaxID=261697 RepID=A0AAN6Y9A2_9PEZI|nr:bola protein [Rhypophila decipiens]
MICRSCLRTGARAEASLLSSTPSRRPFMRIPGRPFSSVTTPARAPPAQISRTQPQIVGWSQRFYSASAGAPSPLESTKSVIPEKPELLSEGESQIWDILVAELFPTELVVKDISGGCGSMYGIDIVSEKFRGLNMLKQQRLVNAALGDLVKEWHGLQLKTRTP